MGGAVESAHGLADHDELQTGARGCRLPARVSTVASIGYPAFLIGPPLIGFLNDHIGVRDALLVVVGMLTVTFTVAGRCAPLATPKPVTADCTT